jgi:BMFP domain-containing protein YqiC
MSIQTQAQVEDLQRKVKELESRPVNTELEKRVADLEAKYKMLNARVGWNKDKAA